MWMHQFFFRKRKTFGFFMVQQFCSESLMIKCVIKMYEVINIGILQSPRTSHVIVVDGLEWLKHMLPQFLNFYEFYYCDFIIIYFPHLFFTNNINFDFFSCIISTHWFVIRQQDTRIQKRLKNNLQLKRLSSNEWSLSMKEICITT